jgi:hypothetical protein
MKLVDARGRNPSRHALFACQASSNIEPKAARLPLPSASRIRSASVRTSCSASMLGTLLKTLGPEDFEFLWACGPPVGMKVHYLSFIDSKQVSRDFRRSVMASLEKSRNSLQKGVSVKPLFMLRCDRIPVVLTWFRQLSRIRRSAAGTYLGISLVAQTPS